MKTINNKKIIIKGIILYFFTICLVGFIRVNLIFGIIKIPINSITKFSAYFSLITGTTIICILLLIIVFICYSLNELFKVKLSNSIFFNCTFYSIVILIICEIVKLAYVYIYLKPKLIENSKNVELLNILLNSEFKNYCDFTDYISYFFISLFFFFMTMQEEKIFQSLTISISFGGIISLAKYFLN